MQLDDAIAIGEEAQASLIRAFAAGEVAGVQAPVVRVDTHLNHVFLSGDKAFKLKRAVKLPFVDFRSIEQRRKACISEIVCNTLLGSPFYVSAQPVTIKSDGGFRLGGGAEPQDWVVVMKRFEASSEFGVRARAGRLTVEDTESAASLIADMHAHAWSSTLAGHAADLRHVIRSLRQTEVESTAALGLEPGSGELFDRLDAELTRVSPLIERRRAAGKVRRVHGDLHLGNLCMFEGKPAVFDALEFDARMATTDVLYDLAFLLMDLRRCGLVRHASAAMNRYWDEAGEEEEALQLLPFFMSLRAAVRMSVLVAQGDLEEAQQYTLLVQELLDHCEPAFIAVGGLSGAGKSAVAKELAHRLPGPAGARLLRSDVLRKQLLGIGQTARADAAAYAPEKRAMIYRDLALRAAAASRAGASVVADATFRVANARESIAAAGRRFRGFWLESPLHVRLSRVASRGADPSDADVDVAMKQQEPCELGPRWSRIDARPSVQQIADEILRRLS